jgi:hypothetical protein
VGEPVAGDDAGQDRVADRVGHHRHLTQDQERAEQRAGAGDQDAGQDDDKVSR